MSSLFYLVAQQLSQKNPVGIEPFSPSTEQIEGIWLSDNEVIKIKIISEAEGMIKIAWIEDNESDFKLETATGKLMKGNKGFYINALKLLEEDFDGYYIWGKIHFEDKKIIIWPPSFKDFELAYKNNEIKAMVEKNKKQEITTIQLTDDAKTLVELIEKNTSFFDRKDPIILIKIIEY